MGPYRHNVMSFDTGDRRPLGLAGGERIDSPGVVRLSGTKEGGREVQLVGRVWKVLRLATEARTPLIGVSPFASQGAVEVVPGIEGSDVSTSMTHPLHRPAARNW